MQVPYDVRFPTLKPLAIWRRWGVSSLMTTGVWPMGAKRRGGARWSKNDSRCDDLTSVGSTEYTNGTNWRHSLEENRVLFRRISDAPPECCGARHRRTKTQQQQQDVTLPHPSFVKCCPSRELCHQSPSHLGPPSSLNSSLSTAMAGGQAKLQSQLDDTVKVRETQLFPTKTPH